MYPHNTRILSKSDQHQVLGKLAGIGHLHQWWTTTLHLLYHLCNLTLLLQLPGGGGWGWQLFLPAAQVQVALHTAHCTLHYSETPGGKTRLSQVYSLPRDLRYFLTISQSPRGTPLSTPHSSYQFARSRVKFILESKSGRCLKPT